MAIVQAMDSIGWALFIGPTVMGFCIYFGLVRVAEAIEYYTDNINKED